MFWVQWKLHFDPCLWSKTKTSLLRTQKLTVEVSKSTERVSENPYRLNEAPTKPPSFSASRIRKEKGLWKKGNLSMQKVLSIVRD